MLYIAGKWVKGEGEELKIHNPYTKKYIGSTHLASQKQADAAVEGAVLAKMAMRQLSGMEKSRILCTAMERLETRADEVAKLIVDEIAKPIKDAKGEVARGIYALKVAAEEAHRNEGIIMDLGGSVSGLNRKCYIEKAPRGLILGITPFNFPLNLVLHKVAPALASGNCIIIKSAPQSPLCALEIAKLFDGIGLPEGALSVISCDNTVAESLVRDDRIDMLSFTGSDTVGWHLKAISGRKHVALELGGNACAIVHDPDLIDNAVERCAVSAYSHSGQSCISVQNIFVRDDIYDEFLAKFTRRMEKVRFGDPHDPDTSVSALVDERAKVKIKSLLDSAVAGGGRIVSGGYSGDNCLPTVITGITLDNPVCVNEAFAPVVNLHKYNKIDEVIDFINNSSYGLQAGIFTNNISVVNKLYNNIDIGGVVVRDVPTFRTDDMPYGGVKNSGIGKEGVRWAMDDMCYHKIKVVPND